VKGVVVTTAERFDEARRRRGHALRVGRKRAPARSLPERSFVTITASLAMGLDPRAQTAWSSVRISGSPAIVVGSSADSHI
jgi:hypothetical protein